LAKVKINKRKIDSGVQRAFMDAALIVHRNIVMVISEPGAFEGFDGDIVDTGNLRANQQPPEIRGNTAIFRNTAEYAIYVYLGYTFRNGSSQPGRPWMKLGLERSGFDAAFAQLLKAGLS
jgi:hypothetical protein